MSQSTTKRPPQVNLAGTIVIVGSVLLLLSAWNRVATLRSLESREGIDRFLGSQVGEGLGLDFEQAVGLVHVAALVAGGCAVATAILGWFVLRRDTTSRLALTVLAVPMFFAGVFVDEFTAAFVAAATAMLWLSPAREWFATGSWTPPPPRQPKPADDRSGAGSWPPPPSAPVGGTGPQHPDTQHPDAQHAPPPPQARPFGSTMAPPHPQAPVDPRSWGSVPQERPRSVVTAAVVTIVMSVLVGVMMVLALVVFGMAPEILSEELERQGMTLPDGVSFERLRALTMAVMAFCLVLCVLALTFAGFLLTGRDWARWALMITAAFTAGGCLLVVASGGFAALVPAFAAMLTVVLLRRPESRAWCQASTAARRG